jgi:hypothetical protein
VTSLFEPPAAAVFGVASVAWPSPPKFAEYEAAAAGVAALVAALSTPTEGRAPYCGCAGDAPVSAAADSEFAYAPVAGSGLPAAECAARLSATSAVGAYITDESTPPAPWAYCSSPGLVAGGVEGVPDPAFNPPPLCWGPLGVVTPADLVNVAGAHCNTAFFPDPATCAPLGYDTVAAMPCSTPALDQDPLLPPGIAGVPTVGTCGVESSFRTGAGGARAACLLLVTATPVPAPPAPAPCADGAGAALDNVPCMPIANDNENANENTNVLTNENANEATNDNAQTITNAATGGASGDSASSSTSNPTTTVTNSVAINVGATGR